MFDCIGFIDASDAHGHDLFFVQHACLSSPRLCVCLLYRLCRLCVPVISVISVMSVMSVMPVMYVCLFFHTASPQT